LRLVAVGIGLRVWLPGRWTFGTTWAIVATSRRRDCTELDPVFRMLDLRTKLGLPSPDLPDEIGDKKHRREDDGDEDSQLRRHATPPHEAGASLAPGVEIWLFGYFVIWLFVVIN
jgi:hypothetical protein